MCFITGWYYPLLNHKLPHSSQKTCRGLFRDLCIWGGKRKANCRLSQLVSYKLYTRIKDCNKIIRSQYFLLTFTRFHIYLDDKYKKYVASWLLLFVCSWGVCTVVQLWSSSLWMWSEGSERNIKLLPQYKQPQCLLFRSVLKVVRH